VIIKFKVISIYDNTFRIDEVAYRTSTQHPDFVQNVGNYTKIYNNDFINIGDSGIDSDSNYSAGYLAPHDIRIYNNTFRIVDALDPYPEYIRFYDCEQTLTDIKIFNNVFLDNINYSNIRFTCGATTTGSGNEIKNNIWHSSAGSHNALSFSSADLAPSFDLNNNIYSGDIQINYLGTYYSATTWIANNEPHSSTSQPLFTSYTANDINNDLRLSSSDTVAKNHGADLSAYFTTDKNGITRPAGAWDIGAYEYVSGDTTPPSSPTGLSVS